MLDAVDRSEVLSWSKRQLGDGATRSTVLELAGDLISGWVEKSGTGLNRSGCGAVGSVMADSVQLVGAPRGCALTDREAVFPLDFSSCKSTVH
jgi:hypothetical protein